MAAPLVGPSVTVGHRRCLRRVLAVRMAVLRGGRPKFVGGLSRENGAVGTKVRGRFHLAAQCGSYRVSSS